MFLSIVFMSLCMHVDTPASKHYVCSKEVKTAYIKSANINIAYDAKYQYGKFTAANRYNPPKGKIFNGGCVLLTSQGRLVSPDSCTKILSTR